MEQIRSAADPVGFIRGLVNSTPPTYESDWLDFKLPPNTDLKDAKWRSLWIEALCGFANNQGGVLIWGIDARKDPETGVDAACGEKPVDNPAGVKSRLIELQRQATDPPLANVEIESYEIPSALGMGFVVCYVPEGPFKPYRAEDGKRSQYHIRAGDSFVVMSRSVLQAMFYPRSRAVFKTSATVSWGLVEKNLTGGRNVAQMECNVELTNTGTATANRVFVVVEEEPGGVTGSFTYSGPWAQSTTKGKRQLGGSQPIHPGQTLLLFTAVWRVGAGPRPASGGRVVPNCPAQQFSLAIYCENQERQDIRLDFDMETLIEQKTCSVERGPTG